MLAAMPAAPLQGFLVDECDFRHPPAILKLHGATATLYYAILCTWLRHVLGQTFQTGIFALIL